MRAVLEALATRPGVLPPVFLVERSPARRAEQQATLGEAGGG